MAFLDFSKVKKGFTSPPGDIYYKLESLIAIHHSQPFRVYLNFGASVAEVVFDQKDKEVNQTVKDFIAKLASGNADIEEFIPKITVVTWSTNHFIKS